MGAKPKRRGKWGHYLKKGLELGALGAVQFVPGLDLVADAAIAGEVAEGAAVATEAAEAVESVEAVEGAESSGGLLKKGMDYYDQANQYYSDFQDAQGYVNQMTSYRQPASLSYRGQPPTQVGAAQGPAPRHYLGPMQKKLLICGLIFLILLIIGALVARHFVRSCHGCSKSI
jgi:hypothetical protein